MRLMLVDDEPVILHGLEKIIRRRGPEIDICCFESPLEALNEIAYSVPDLLITDIYMPELNGLEFIARAKALGCTRIVLLSGHNEFEIAREAIRLQSMDYLLKPIQKPELFRVLDVVTEELAQRSIRESGDTALRLRLMTLYGVLPDEFGASAPLPKTNQRGALALLPHSVPAIPALANVKHYDLGIDEAGWRLILGISTDDNALNVIGDIIC